MEMLEPPDTVEAPEKVANGQVLSECNEEDNLPIKPQESSQSPVKKKRTKKVTKRKKSQESTDDENDEKEPKDKKKKRKKPSKKVFERRNIKAVFSEENLEESTKNALAEEQQRLQRLQQAQRDAFANDVLRDFDLGILKGMKSEDEDEENEAKVNEKPPLEALSDQVTIKKEDRDATSACINLSSDEEAAKSKAATLNELPALKKKEDSDSSDIQILSDVEVEDEDDPDNSGMHTNDRLNVRTPEGKVVVNVSEKNPPELVHVADSIEGVIKPHQIGGVRFLYDNIIESPSVYEKSQGFGCILAHAMGLGKTLQVVTFCDVFLRATKGRHILIIVPINTLQNWVNEFKHWLPAEPFKVHLLSDGLKTITARANVINNWNENGGVLMIGYELFRLLAGTKAQQRKKKVSAAKKKPVCIDIEEEDKEKDLLVDVRKILVDPGPDLVICDEGHRIKNAHASISQVLKAIRTKRRVVLTGYPLQNNLMEYWCMVDFVRPNYLGNKTEFSNMFERPIQNGQCVDSTPRDVRLMMHRAHVLHSLLKGFVQRRSHRVLRKNLPPKYEHVLLVKMTPFQRKLYATFTEDLLAQRSVANPLKAFAVCCKIWNHPDVLCDFLREKEASLEFDLDLEDIPRNGKKGGGRNAKKRGGKKNSKAKNQKQPEAGPQPGFEGVPHEIMNGNGYNGNGHGAGANGFGMDPNQYMQQGNFAQQQQYPYDPYQGQQQGQMQNQYPPYDQQQQMFQQPQSQAMYDEFSPQHNTYRPAPGAPGSEALQMLQRHVDQQPHIVQAEPDISSPSKMLRDGPGFDPYAPDPAKRDEISYDWANGMFSDYVSGLLETSNKFLVFFKLLEETIKVGERLLLFSQSLLTLDLMEVFLKQRNIPTTDETWANGQSYFRLDGSTPSSERDRLINAFNAAEAIKVPLFLVSTRAGSLGINLVGANRVVIFDASWNPCHDSQAVCRVYRYGQSKPCYIYRLVSDKCLEKKIYDRQVNKQGMSDRVVDEANPDNYLSTKDVHSLWGEEDLLRELHYAQWDVQGCVDKCTKLGDHVLANVLVDLGVECLSQFPFTHESLLIDRKDKKLSRIEKRIAERSFEAEKHAQISYSRPSYAAFYPRGDEGNPARNQNYIGCRKESWKPPPIEDDREPVSYQPPKMHPHYNGMGPPAASTSTSGYPATSQPLNASLPGGPGNSNDRNKFPLEALARREGVKLQEVYVPRDIVIPTKNQAPIALKAGQRVMLIKTPKGIYMRLRDQIVKIRVPNGLMPFGPLPPGMGSGTPPGSSSKRNFPPTASSSSRPQSKPDVVTLHSSGEDE